METIIIRKSKRNLYGLALMTSIAILYYFLGPYNKTRTIYDQSPKFTIFLGFIFFGILFYSLYELITRKGEIILSSDGIEIRDKEWNHWDYVQSYWTITEPRENSTDEYLIVQTERYEAIKMPDLRPGQKPGRNSGFNNYV